MQLSPKILLALLQAVAVNAQTFPALCSTETVYTYGSLDSTPGVLRASIPLTDSAEGPIGSITFGIKTLPMLFDTGSSTDWVIGPAAVAGTGHKSVALTHSPPGLPVPRAYFCVTFSGTSAFGPLYSTVFTAGGIPFPAYPLGVANTTSPGFVDPSIPYSGLIGFSPPGSNKDSPMMRNWLFKNVNLYQDKVLGITWRKSGTGAADLGFTDTTKYAGSLQYTAPPAVTTSARFWVFQSNGIKLTNGTVIAAPHQSLVDTGEPNVKIRRASFDGYLAEVRKQVPGAAPLPPTGQSFGYTVPCISSPPDLNIEFGSGRYVTIKGTLLIGPQVAPLICLGRVQAQFDSENFQLIGAPLYQSNYVAHRLDNLTLGFAPLR